VAEPESWYADAEQGSGIDWFGVEIGVHVDGQKINLLPILLEQLQLNPRLISEETLAAHRRCRHPDSTSRRTVAAFRCGA